MLMAMARDLRVVLIKLADRQHNLATMSAVRPDKRRRIAAKTLEIYAPIAPALGLNKLYRELRTRPSASSTPSRRRAGPGGTGGPRQPAQNCSPRSPTASKGKLKAAGLEADVFGRERAFIRSSAR